MTVSIPSRGSGKGDSTCSGVQLLLLMFQSPLGEVVKETWSNQWIYFPSLSQEVSIPSRGSGKGDPPLREIV